MLRTFLLLTLAVLCIEANKCRYRELKAPYSEIRRPRRCRGAGSFIGEDYWTTVGYDGVIRGGRSRDDFLTFQQSPSAQGYVAYWITRSKYGDVHYEAFGHAFVRPDNRVCAWFVGLNKEMIEVCGGFRVLSRNRYNPSEENPFEWVHGGSIRTKDALGFHEHRIAKYATDEEEVFYGDAGVNYQNFQGVAPTSQRFVEVTSPLEFDEKVWVLRRKNDLLQTSYDFTNRRQQNDRRDPYGYRQTVQRVESNIQPEQRQVGRQEIPREQQPYQNTENDESAAQRQRIGTGVFPNDETEHQSSQSADKGRVEENVGSIQIGRGVQPNSSEKVRYARIRPPTIVRDQYGNTYERRVENGYTIFYADPHVQGKRIDTAVQRQVATGIDARYNNNGWLHHREQMRKLAEERRAQEQRMRNAWLLDNASGISPENTNSDQESEWQVETEPSDRIKVGSQKEMTGHPAQHRKRHTSTFH